MMKTSSPTAKIFPALLTLILGSTLVLSGCQSAKNLLGKRDNGSLEYQQSKKLVPIELPANKEPAPFVPLYVNIIHSVIQKSAVAARFYHISLNEQELP